MATTVVTPAIRRALWEEELAKKKDKERALKRESVRISDEIKALRPRIYELVEWLKEMNAEETA